MYCECEEYPSAVEKAQFAAGWKDLLNRHDVLLLDTETSYKELFEIAVINTCHTSRKEPLIDNLVIPTRDIEPCWRWKHRITIDQMRKKKESAAVQCHSEETATTYRMRIGDLYLQ